MSANRLFLVCSHHPKIEDSLLLAERTDSETQYFGSFYAARHDLRRVDDWFEKHANCGRTRDHFQLAMHRPANWDVAPPAEKTVAGGVRLALVNGGTQ